MRIKNILLFASISFLIGSFCLYFGAKSILAYQGHSFESINHNRPAMLSKKSFLADILLQLSVLKETFRNHFFLQKNNSYMFYQDLDISKNHNFSPFNNELILFTHSLAPEVILINKNGTQLHRWFIDPKTLFPNHLFKQLVIKYAELKPDGSLYYIYEAQNQTPYGFALIYLDKDSNIIWQSNIHTHHSLTIEDEGIFSLFHDFQKSDTSYYLDDGIIHFTHQGKVKGKYSFYDIFSGTDFMNFIPSIRFDSIHANSITSLKKPIILGNVTLNVGDFLVSLRNINVIAVIDSKSMKVKWAVQNITKMQHSAYQLENGNFIIYDNWAHLNYLENRQGFSQIVEIDPRSLKKTWFFSGNENINMATPYSSNVFEIDQNRFLVCLDKKSIFEVNRNKQLSWHFKFPAIFARPYLRDQLKFLDTP